MVHSMVAVSLQLPQLVINPNYKLSSKCYVHHKKKHYYYYYSNFICFALKKNNSNCNTIQNPPIFSLKFSSFSPLSESPQASFDDYIEDEARLLRATFSGKSEKINQDDWRVEMPSFQVLFLKMGWELKGLSKDFKASKIKINVKGAMYAERTKSKSVLTNNLLLNLYNLAPQKPIDFFAQDFLQPLVEKGLKGMMEEIMKEFTENLLLDYNKYKKETQKNEVPSNYI
ncbi:uncharacterized protein LOC101213732 isoform X2 [Cucumis sativus]|uniref:uncharacterized protein LOC101213732 isoform X2 n=1 Tax=Cucumis sativus TaxID=3659 RepID=UPI0002B40DDF|nr:uncharacterized protein LOC101213732 isoform X2 [Cucumis sativus]KGN59700.2 hypothetical protein Csa_000724 [Cucumis sativus]